MDKFKRGLKILFIILAFLFINIIIDVATGASLGYILPAINHEDISKANDYAIYSILAGQLIKLAILYFYIRKRDKTFRRNENRSYILTKEIKNPLLFVGIGFGTVGFGQIFTNTIINIFTGSELLARAMDLLKNVFNPRGPVDGIAILLVTIIGAPLVEELLFRGVLFEELKRECSFKITIFLTALIFGYYHFNIIQTPNTFFMGLVLAYVYYKTKSIKASIIVHATNNILAMIPFLDRGLSPLGYFIDGILLLIGIYSLLTLMAKA